MRRTSISMGPSVGAIKDITDAFLALAEFHTDFDTSDGHVGNDDFAFSGTFSPRPRLVPIQYKPSYNLTVFGHEFTIYFFDMSPRYIMTKSTSY